MTDMELHRHNINREDGFVSSRSISHSFPPRLKETSPLRIQISEETGLLQTTTGNSYDTGCPEEAGHLLSPLYTLGFPNLPS
jgi:hypothetical protein